MVKILALAALPAIFAQSAMESISAARATMRSEDWLSKNAGKNNYVQMQKAWVDQAEAAFNKNGFLPDSVKLGLQELAGNTTDSRSSFDKHCEDGNCIVPFGLDRIWGYGCWCHFGADLMVGHGQPQNVFDAICKDLQLCLRCAKWDGKNEGYGCDPVTQTWNGGSGPDFITQCTAGNPDNDCASHVCSCEQTIIAEIMDLAFQPHTPENEYTDVYLHSNGFVFGEENCPKANGPQYDAECCGLYPKRFPFGSGNPNKACCADVTIYNPVYQECCNDGTAADAGSCPSN